MFNKNDLKKIIQLAIPVFFGIIAVSLAVMAINESLRTGKPSESSVSMQSDVSLQSYLSSSDSETSSLEESSSDGSSSSLTTSSEPSSLPPSSTPLSSFSSSAIQPSPTLNPNIRDGIRVYSIPEGTPTVDSLFSVTANGKEIGLLSDNNGWNHPVSFGVFDIDEGYEVEIKVTVDFDFSSVAILPEKLGIKSTIKDNVVTFKINKIYNDITLVFDEIYFFPTLHLFMNPIDYDAPSKSTNDIIYFAPGYYNLKDHFNGKLTVGSNKTLYLAGGAVVDGTVLIWNSSNVTVRGSGILMKSDQASQGTGTENITLSFNKGSNITIKDVVVHSHRNPNWTIHVYNSGKVTLDRIKVISTRFASTDALDITNSQDITVTNSFLRACDDTITLKGLMGSDPAFSPPVENIHVSKCVLWNDANNAMVVGEESKAKYYKNISFKDIDVLFSYDDKNHHTQLDERAAITICSLHGTYFSDIVWENIRVNRCERLICFTFKDSFYFGSLLGDQSYPGGIDNILVKNVTSKSTSNSSIANEIILHGWSDSKKITNVTFENVVVNGQKVTADYPRLDINQYIGSVYYK